ncbi:hypothetical protein KR009_001775 [Drosophila setifemur]|nr:hypothetical protein KR009_001775 [Drosophila setifemur]
MLRSIFLLLLISTAVNARAAPKGTNYYGLHDETTWEVPVEESTTFMSIQSARTMTVDVESDEILITSPEGEIFTEASPINMTEEPLPDSVLQQLEMERAQDEGAQEVRTENLDEPQIEETTQPDTVAEPATTSTEPSITESKTTTKRYVTFKFGATTLPPFLDTTTSTPVVTTVKLQDSSPNSASNTEETTAYPEVTTMRSPVQLVDGDLQMDENRMKTKTESTRQEQTNPPLKETTTLANLVKENSIQRDADQEEYLGTTVISLLRLINYSAPVVTEAQPTATTVEPEDMEAKVTTLPAIEEITTEILPPSSSKAPETTIKDVEATEPAVSSITTTESSPVTTTIELMLYVQSESTATSAPETTTTSLTTSTESTTSSTTITTTTTEVPTTTTTTDRPILTRAPRVERIFNSDGVEVLYGYSSVLRANRS